MKIVFENNNLNSPKLSIILLDWSCRESFHIFDYLSNQTEPREQYEVIWIEYYRRHSPEIEARLKKCKELGMAPFLDKWIIMEMPDNTYYHKHLMYNIGIIVSEGHIITFMDSDAILKPSFIRSIMESFNKDSNVILHMDQVRNVNKKFYPFNHPSIKQVANEDYSNLLNGKPKGLIDKSAPLHLRNYGACMSAKRDDLISIGGADEHTDYLGHICGPYEMTFRLVNAGQKEIWHQDEWLYHTWHPGQSGDNNYVGPHDGRFMSQTALSIRKTGRVLPLVENRAIRMLRLEKEKIISEKSVLSLVLSGVNYDRWRVDIEQYSTVKYWLRDKKIKMMAREKNVQRGIKNTPRRLIGISIFIKVLIQVIKDSISLIQEVFIREKNNYQKPHQSAIGPKTQKIKKVRQILIMVDKFFRQLKFNTLYTIGRCDQCLQDLSSINISEVAIYCTGVIAQVLISLSERYSIEIAGIYNNTGSNIMGYEVLPLETLKNYDGKVIIASFDNTEQKTDILIGAGVNPKMIVDLW